ncbi:MAG: carboxy terminal-processing peptidase [Bacteroidetes bacterium]|nr:carboxy terminal-processing peptidase [Bacteroidota bacterium]
MMKRIKLAALSLVCLAKIAAQSTDTLCYQQTLVMASLLKHHISPPEFNTPVNVQVLGLFMEQADPRGLFILEADKATMLTTVQTEPVADVYCRLLHQSIALFKQRRNQVDSIVTVLEKTPFTFSSKDSITFVGQKTGKVYAKDLRHLRNRIERRIKYDCLNYCIKAREGEDPEKLTAKDLETKLAEAKKIAIIKYRRYLSEFNHENHLSHHLADILSNAIAMRCDPHSNYFDPFEKENFDSGLSTEEMSFGFYASDNEDGDIIISGLLPGGAAWKSNKLHEGDVILGFQFQNEKKTDLQYVDIDEFYELFSASHAVAVELTIRRKDNQVIKVQLQKTKIQSVENTLNSFVLYDSTSRFGYIPIPSFYTDDENDGRLGCANDVAKEIIKLKTENISGLILDLRYNGGGSMYEAMGLAGIFIDEGPVAIFKSKAPKASVLKDLNRGSIYDGPLIIMVNTNSASASEFLTATLQDYNRALIVGSTTYGKGTAQNIYPADTLMSRDKKGKLSSSIGFVKITTGKFYRIKAVSHQGKGIVPDVHIPDMTERIAGRESDEKYFLPGDSVNKKVVYTPLDAFPVEKLNALSGTRVTNSKSFGAIINLGDSIAHSREKDYKMALTFSDYKQYYKKQEAIGDRITAALAYTSPAYNISNNEYTRELIKIDEFQQKLNAGIRENLEKDIILNETFLILKDLITLTKK